MQRSLALSAQLSELRSLIGLRYGSQPGQFNCWTFTQLVHQRVFSRKLVDVEMENDSILYLTRLIDKHTAHEQWKKINNPMHGALVELSHKTLPHHVGTYLDFDGGGIIHCDIGMGSVFNDLTTMRLVGWRGFTYYDWIG